MSEVSIEENRRRMQAGEWYQPTTGDVLEDRRRCLAACNEFNTTNATYTATRRQLVGLWKKIISDDTPLPPQAATAKEDAALPELRGYPYIDGPIRVDYGYNLKFGKEVYINWNSTFADTATITIGSRTLIGPNCAFYTVNHPTDPFHRNGLLGPERGSPIVIGEDCWIGGNVVVLPGVKIGRGVTVGAGSVVTKDVEDWVVAVGNPARVVKRLERREWEGVEEMRLAGGRVDG
ncbi:hypothetical protein OQA88_10028 [Cercophora sp. LCS_1]